MANIFANLGYAIVQKAIAGYVKKLAKQATTAIEAFNLEVTIDNATDVAGTFIKAKTGFEVPKQIDTFVDGILVKIADGLRDKLVDYVQAKTNS